MSDRFSTGVPVLDRELDGGVPPGTVAALLAEPASQAGLFLAEFADRHETLYLSAERSPTAVSRELRCSGSPDDLAVTALDRDAPVVDALGYVDQLPDDTLVVVDPVDSLERTDPGQYRAFLSELRATVAQTGGIAVVYGLKHDDAPPQRHRTEYMADLVFDLRTVADGDGVENRLRVPKFRGGRALTDALRVSLTDRITVDTSRDIA
ncbi:RAD55 family ATPase [Halosimplex salinum]|uniref:RAD55 family ATPase n=1 Tax=Halosimplex salinum TaxID=1710538 RepID=UPI0019D17CA6|nr:transcriptional regulator [Halosimplex salinum]